MTNEPKQPTQPQALKYIEQVEGMGTYRTAKNIETVNKHDLLQAIEKLREEHAK